MAQPMEVVFSFDTTGSMSQVLDEVKGRITDIVQRLQADIPGFRVGIIAHGDYCDREHFYVIRRLDITNSLPDVVNFVTETEGTGGGDIPECYELALNYASCSQWSPGSNRILVIIGDAYPHEPDYHQNVGKIDWRKELDALDQKGVKIYAVQVQNDDKCTEFFTTLTEKTGGQLLKLTNMQRICEVIMGVCYREKGAEFFQNYEAEVRQKQSANFATDLEDVFGTLRREESRLSDATAVLNDEEDDDVTKEAGQGKEDSVNTPLVQRQSRKRKAPSDEEVDKIPKKRQCPTSEDVKSTPKKRTVKFPPQARDRNTKLSASSNIKLRRERVFSTQFKYRHLAWSHWKLAICPSDLQTKKWGDWKTVPQCGSKTALWRRDLLNSCPTQSRKSDKSEILFEASIMRPKDCRRRVVSSHISKAVRNFSLPWYRCLFRSVRHHLNEAANDDCKVFLRWARVPSSQSSSISDLRSTYDYAWNNGRSSSEM